MFYTLKTRLSTSKEYESPVAAVCNQTLDLDELCPPALRGVGHSDCLGEGKAGLTERGSRGAVAGRTPRSSLGGTVRKVSLRTLPVQTT